MSIESLITNEVDLNNNNLIPKESANNINLLFDNKILNKALSIFVSILEKKNDAHVFSSIKILVNAMDITLIGLNQDIAAIKKCSALNLGSESAEIIVNGHILYDIIKRISTQEISIIKNTNDNFLQISAASFKCKIPLQDNVHFAQNASQSIRYGPKNCWQTKTLSRD